MKNKCLINDKMHKRIWNPNNDYLHFRKIKMNVFINLV